MKWPLVAVDVCGNGIALWQDSRAHLGFGVGVSKSSPVPPDSSGGKWRGEHSLAKQDEAQSYFLGSPSAQNDQNGSRDRIQITGLQAGQLTPPCRFQTKSCSTSSKPAAALADTLEPPYPPSLTYSPQLQERTKGTGTNFRKLAHGRSRSSCHPSLGQDPQLSRQGMDGPSGQTVLASSAILRFLKPYHWGTLGEGPLHPVFATSCDSKIIFK